MGDEIKLNVDVFAKELGKLTIGIGEFEPYNTKFIDNVIDELSVCNSDFVTSYTKVLKFMKDTKAPALLKKLKAIESAASLILEEFNEADRDIASNIKEGGWS